MAQPLLWMVSCRAQAGVLSCRQVHHLLHRRTAEAHTQQAGRMQSPACCTPPSDCGVQGIKALHESHVHAIHHTAASRPQSTASMAIKEESWLF